MRRLPALAAERTRWVLPMADRSVVALAGSLLADEPSRAGAPLAVALANDPPLLLWTVCVADRREGLRPGCVGDLARWLAQHALQVLQWQGDEHAHAASVWADHCESSADRVCRAVALAELAARLAGVKEPSAAEAAFLLGLLHDAEGWLATAAHPPAEGARNCLPAWLVEACDAPAAALVGLAAGVLAGEAPPADCIEIDVESCRSRGEEARRRWLAPAEGAADWLPLLIARLARLASLEGEFQARLEAEKLAAMAEFAAGAGHEINNPLTVIAGRAQLLLRDEVDPERRRALALVSAQAKRAHEMIADMMLFARPPQPEPAAVDVVALADRVIEDVSPRAAPQEITVSRVGDAGPVEIQADGTQLTVALRAMCQNSIEAIGHRGHVEIGVHAGPGEVAIRVADDGPGIPPEQRSHVFDPFYSARQAGRGLGLGLSKCWRIVANHGGRIEVNSRPGEGTVFTIRLPQRQP